MDSAILVSTMLDRRPVFLIPLLAMISFAGACTTGGNANAVNSNAPRRSITVAGKFAYPIGPDKIITQAKDSKDDWFNALDFGEDNHLGEDWNKNSGGNTDCGEPVYAAGDGEITYASDAGPGWGNVVIVTHTLADGKKVQSLYGHMQEILKTSGEIKRREQIGKIGNANDRYLCHLHFEIREESSPMWNNAGPGYSTDRTGSLDPSDFIDSKKGAK